MNLLYYVWKKEILMNTLMINKEDIKKIHTFYKPLNKYYNIKVNNYMCINMIIWIEKLVINILNGAIVNN